mmetsp:Transcript_31712/g.67978  ORF Transcript_31712/g.67978 Transcript_31712/m.67978 type:complete len:392 (-) Transcript_31712:52-1227(-)|eukprot:CAMPEP_0206551392 /NCGR_PEP_ID=MMETSP0325_2-20121206/15506_1 /ASSEMBLY_ACC=CAM_ASM_000347 /TAXON_ID=2866 /ORGANISM="Crypthecodinium cohnii, Strain Seligo" /LENGTH=391 /DNA_ID=CAMNT_0054051163 /DNA_START=212 /DNA_END=1387 /DNA_ORIENTATION=-
MTLWDDIEVGFEENWPCLVTFFSGVIVTGVAFLSFHRCRRQRRESRELPRFDSSADSERSTFSRRSTIAELALPVHFVDRMVPLSRRIDSPNFRQVVGLGSLHHSDDRSDAQSDSSASFYSCDDSENFLTGSQGGGRRHSRGEDGPRPSARLPIIQKVKHNRRNKNLIQQYSWLEPLLSPIVENQAAALGVMDGDTKEPCTPLFVLAGTCPSTFPPTPMQAALFCVRPSGASDFWWVKPEFSEKQFNPELLSRSTRGKTKNAPGDKSRNAYHFLLRRFVKGAKFVTGNITFGVNSDNRAYIEEETAHNMRRRMVLYFIWVEVYSSVKATLEGKICFERPLPRSAEGPRGPPTLRARQFWVQNTELRLGPYEDEEFLSGVIPGDGFQEMYQY